MSYTNQIPYKSYTTAERNALTGLPIGFKITNLDNLNTEMWDGASWLSLTRENMVFLPNNSGSEITLYTLVDINAAAEGICAIPADSFDPIGVAVENIPNGESGWIQISGMALVAFDNNTIRGNVAVVSDTADGKAKSIAVPSGTPAQTSHWQEIGHIVDTVSNGANSVARVVLHFN